MASRMTISSLLCHEDPPPHSQQQQPSDSALLPHLRAIHPPRNSYSLPSSASSYVGLDALVHAATEERRRLSGSSTTTDSEDHHRPHSSSFYRDPPQPQPQPQPQPRIHPQQQQQQHRDDYPAQQRSPATSPLNPPLLLQVRQQYHHYPTVHEDNHVHLSSVDHHPQRSHFPTTSPQQLHPQPQSSRHHLDLDPRLQQQHIDLQRQRQHHEQLLLQEQHQQQLLAQERQKAYERTAPPSHGPSMPLQLETPIHSRGRKSDPGQLRHILSPAHTDPILPPPQLPLSDDVTTQQSKKRRYSDSPVHSLSEEEKDRLSREREKMLTGDLGYGRVQSPAVPAPSPRRPGSGSGRKHMSVVDLITPDRERIQIGESSTGRSVISPLGRRSPPGSQIGRAKAAKKSEESADPSPGLKEHTISIVPERVRQRHSSEDHKQPVQEKPIQESSKKPQSRPAPEPPAPKPKEHFQRPHPPPPPTKVQQEDAHEWFLEHYDEYPGPTAPARPEPPPPPTIIPLVSAPASPVVPALLAPKSPVPKKLTPTPTTMPEAAVALEQELEELMVDPPIVVSKVEPDLDMDVDLAVTELVAETLDVEDTKREDVGMEVDVEDELLSLLDDRPPANRRVPPGPMPTPTKPPPLLPVTNDSDAHHASPPATSPSGVLSPAVRQPSARPASERGSMPPPISVTTGRGKDKDEKGERAGSAAGSASTGSKKKAKPTPKPKVATVATTPTTTTATKSRTKPGAKAKSRNSDATPVPAKPGKGVAGGPKKATTSRSRSASAMPGGPEGDPKPEEEEEEEAREDDKLYCVCKTKYDEDRFMIACDRCDEWYHTQCVNMRDLEVDLVDQFICPPCVAKNPHLSLRTTYKRRCLFGLKHADPESPKACHKPARGAFSKYCSDECGVKYMQTRVDAWTKKGGKKDKLWESVKNAEKREGVVVCVEDEINQKIKVEDEFKKEEKETKPMKGKIEREVERLNGLLDQVVKLREEIKKGMEVVVWRERLLELATERAEQVSQCGWDQRLCFGDEEWSDFGAGVLESYEDIKTEPGVDQEMQVDGGGEVEGEWWCPGKTMCDRHAGWQAVRHRDVAKEKEKKEDALLNLTTREREIRKRIEDIIDPHGHKCNDPIITSPLKPSNPKLSNGHTKGKLNGDAMKKGKKRKVPS